jgi:hypothetical protein
VRQHHHLFEGVIVADAESQPGVKLNVSGKLSDTNADMIQFDKLHHPPLLITRAEKRPRASFFLK